MVTSNFSRADANRILCIPLAKFPHDDMLIWSGEASGNFSIQSAYKILLQETNAFIVYYNQSNCSHLYKKNFKV